MVFSLSLLLIWFAPEHNIHNVSPAGTTDVDGQEGDSDGGEVNKDIVGEGNMDTGPGVGVALYHLNA